MNLVRSLATMSLGVICAFSATATTTPLLTDESAWQAASTNNGQNGLTQIDLDHSSFTYGEVNVSSGIDKQAVSSDAAPFSVTFSQNCSLCAPADVGYPSIAGGAATLFTANRTSFQIIFGTPVYAFSADFTPPGPDINNETPLIGLANSNEGISGNLSSGFNGFISNTAFTAITFDIAVCSFSGPGGPPSNHCSGDTLLRNIQVSTASPYAAPEPGEFGMIAGAFGLLLPFAHSRRKR